jgi:hypothetical protein
VCPSTGERRAGQRRDVGLARRPHGPGGFRSWREVLAVLKEHPEWLEINRHVQQKVV